MNAIGTQLRGDLINIISGLTLSMMAYGGVKSICNLFVD